MARKPPQPSASEDDEDYTSAEDEEVSLQEVTAVNLGDDRKPKHYEAEEEDDDDESDDEEEAEDDGKDKTPVKAPAAVHQDNSDSESESDPSSPSPSQFAVKPIVSKPADSKPKKTEKKQKIKSLNKVTTPVPTPVTSVVENPKTSLGSAKLWNEEDEITVFKGMITLKAEKGSDPLTDIAAFYDFIKGSLLVPVSKSQLSDKIKRLRKKYKTNVEKGRNGEDPVFTKPHEQISFDLSKKIWGHNVSTETSNTTTANVNATTVSANANATSANVISNAKVGSKRKAKTGVVSVNARNEVTDVATVLALPIKESNVGSSVGGKKQKTVTKKEKEKEVANSEGNELLKMKEKQEEVVEDQAPVSFNHSTKLFGLKDGKLEEMLFDSLTKTENGKANELKKKWSEFQTDQLKLYIRKTELLKETTMLVLDDMMKP